MAHVRAGIGSQVLTTVFFLLFVFTLVLILASIPVGFYTVLAGTLSKTYGPSSLGHPYFYIGPFLAILPVSVSLGALFTVFTLSYVALLAYVILRGVSPAGALVRSLRSGVGSLFSSGIVVVVTSIGFLVFSAAVADYLVSVAGSPIGNLPQTDPFALLLGFTIAPLVEEAGFRVALIGGLALLIALGRPLKDVLNALWRPSSVYDSGRTRSASMFAIAAMLFASSFVFGYAHVAAGWGPGKLFEASYGGIVLGWLYIRYGLPAAVLAHWGVDYFGSIFAFFGQAAYGIPWNSTTTEYLLQSVIDIDMLALFGLLSFLVVIYLGLTRLSFRRTEAVTAPVGSS